MYKGRPAPFKNESPKKILTWEMSIHIALLFFCMFVLIAWFILGLVNPSLNNPLVRIIHVLADPLITPLQRYLPRTRTDWSPLVGVILFYLISSAIIDPIAFFGGTMSSPVSICIY